MALSLMNAYSVYCIHPCIRKGRWPYCEDLGHERQGGKQKCCLYDKKASSGEKRIMRHAAARMTKSPGVM